MTEVTDNDPADEDEEPIVGLPNDWQLFNRVRKHDIKLLKLLNVEIIVDFMVENKKVKFGMKYVLYYISSFHV